MLGGNFSINNVLRTGFGKIFISWLIEILLFKVTSQYTLLSDVGVCVLQPTVLFKNEVLLLAVLNTFLIFFVI